MSRDINELMVEALEKAKELVTGDRQKDYGTPEESFTRIAYLWTAWLDVKITAEDAAIMMALLKIARLRGGRKTPDTYHDLLGYGAIAYALRAEEEAQMAKAQAHPFAGMKWEPWRDCEMAENPVTDNKQTIITPGLVAAGVGALMRDCSSVHIPDGWRLVPEEPTEEMLNEAVCGMSVQESPGFYSAIYKAMLDKAPAYAKASENEGE